MDQLSARLREDQMQGARKSYEDAEAKVTAAQTRAEALAALDVITIEANAGE